MNIEEQNKAPKVTSNETYPLGLAYLDAILRKEGYNVITKDFANWNEQKAINEIKKIVMEFKPHIVGFSVMSMTRVSTYRAIKEIKNIDDKIKIICGGVHVSVMYEQLLLNFPVDAVVIGEGELTIVELVNMLMQNKSLNKIKGIAYKKNNKVVKNPPRELIEDLDELPFPDHGTFMNSRRTKICMLFSRGCPFNCSFCCLGVISQRRYRKRSYMNVIKEIECTIKKFPQIKEIEFSDDTLTLDEERVINFCKEVVKRGINKKIKFICSGRIKPCNHKMLFWMQKAGFREIRFGIETGSRKMLKAIHKDITPKDIIETFKICAKFKDKIKFVKFLMVGFPGENEETIRETIELTKIIQKYVPMDFFYATPLWVYPGTEVYEIMKSKGKINDSFWLTEKPCPHYTVEYSKEELFAMANRIAFETCIDKGYLYFSKFMIKKFIDNPSYMFKRTNKFLISLLKRKLS